MKTLCDLMLAAGSHLAGIPIQINFATRQYLRAAGCVRVDHSGQVVIDLASGFAASKSDDDLKIFLHEVAHCRLHAREFGRSDTTLAPVWDKPVNDIVATRRALRESQAENQVMAWWHWAEKHAKTELDNGCSRFENYLTALMRY